jgi:hypothetical protein
MFKIIYLLFPEDRRALGNFRFMKGMSAQKQGLSGITRIEGLRCGQHRENLESPALTILFCQLSFPPVDS